MAVPRTTLAQLIARTTRLIGAVDATDTNFGYAAIAEHLSDAQEEVWELLIMTHAGRSQLQTYADITITSSTRLYDKPVDLGTIISAHLLDSSDDEKDYMRSIGHLRNFLPSSAEHVYRDYALSAAGWDFYSRGRIIVLPTPNEAGTLRVFYVPLPCRMHSGTAAAGAASTITLAATATYGEVSTVDDFYNGSFLVPTNDTPTGVVGQVRTITDYDGSSKIATVGTAWGVNPTSSTTYEIMPVVPETSFGYLVALAAERAQAYLGSATWEIAAARAEKARQALLRTLAVTNVMEPEYIGKA